jgi:hypothetical protein
VWWHTRRPAIQGDSDEKTIKAEDEVEFIEVEVAVTYCRLF